MTPEVEIIRELQFKTLSNILPATSPLADESNAVNLIYSPHQQTDTLGLANEQTEQSRQSLRQELIDSLATTIRYDSESSYLDSQMAGAEWDFIVANADRITSDHIRNVIVPYDRAFTNKDIANDSGIVDELVRGIPEYEEIITNYFMKQPNSIFSREDPRRFVLIFSNAYLFASAKKELLHQIGWKNRATIYTTEEKDLEVYEKEFPEDITEEQLEVINNSNFFYLGETLYGKQWHVLQELNKIIEEAKNQSVKTSQDSLAVHMRKIGLVTA